MPHNSPLRARLCGICIAAAITFSVAAAAAANDPEAVYKDLRLFGDIFDRVQKTYVEEVDESKLIESAVRGMLQSLDPHSDYLGPEDFEKIQFDSRGEFGGLGIDISSEDGTVIVISPLDGTPPRARESRPATESSGWTAKISSASPSTKPCGACAASRERPSTSPCGAAKKLLM